MCCKTDFIQESKANGQSCNIVQSIYTCGTSCSPLGSDSSSQAKPGLVYRFTKTCGLVLPSSQLNPELYWCIPVLNNMALHSTFFTVSSIFHNKKLNVNDDIWFVDWDLKCTELGKGQVFRNDFSQSITSVSYISKLSVDSCGII